jgi:GT2 family glycosyltransferase
MNNELTVLVTTHNRLEHTSETFKTLLPTLPADTQVVVYDNASEVDTQRLIEECAATYGNITIIEACDNVGWGTSVNRMLPFVTTDYVLISNNDVDYFDPDWWPKAKALMEKYPNIGVLGLWRHTAHSTLEDKGDLLVRDQMPAVAWLIRKDKLLPFSEHGPCPTKGGNGEDVNYCSRVTQKGWWVAAPKEDLARHMDGY